MREEFEARALQQLSVMNLYPCLMKDYCVAMVSLIS